MKKVVSILFVLALLFSTNIQTVDAHAGNLDKLGGHFAIKEEKYHFHKPSSLLKKAKTKQEVVKLINKYNHNKVKFKITVNSVDWTTYSAASIKKYPSNKTRAGKTFKQMYKFVPK